MLHAIQRPLHLGNYPCLHSWREAERSVWSLNKQYNYGWFVPFFALYLFGFAGKIGRAREEWSIVDLSLIHISEPTRRT
ncbi:MAG TPA: hypothetical protein DCK99_17515, partial [Blastocatellia bacterium]|nr:hypothetical protein [Blastocatellia bacterium]